MKKTSKEEFNRNTRQGVEMQNAPQPDFPVDVAYFQQFLDDPNTSEEEKKILIETVWSIVCSAIDLGFNIHPLQQVNAAQSLSEDSLPAALLLALSEE